MIRAAIRNMTGWVTAHPVTSFVVFFAVFPFLVPYQSLATQVLIFGLFALGFNLLYGHTDFARGARTDSFDRYSIAMSRTPMARLDPRMLENLVANAAFHDRTIARTARNAIAEYYGTEAIPAVTAAIAASTDEEGARSLEILLENLRSSRR